MGGGLLDQNQATLKKLLFSFCVSILFSGCRKVKSENLSGGEGSRLLTFMDSAPEPEKHRSVFSELSPRDVSLSWPNLVFLWLFADRTAAGMIKTTGTARSSPLTRRPAARHVFTRAWVSLRCGEVTCSQPRAKSRYAGSIGTLCTAFEVHIASTPTSKRAHKLMMLCIVSMALTNHHYTNRRDEWRNV